MDNDIDFRFGGIARLFGREALRRLRRSKVMIVGVGGVGSWIVEALARSGVGHLILVDLDDLCISNVNRQLPALDGTVGRPKVEVLAERVRQICGTTLVEPIPEFYTESNSDRLLSCLRQDVGQPVAVVDAIDSVTNKCLLIANCRRLGLTTFVSGAAGGRQDPTRVRVADLAMATHDRILAEVRRRLRKEHGFPHGGTSFGMDAVYSLEAPIFPQPDGTVCAARSMGQTGAEMRLNCDEGLGSAAFVTGAFGFGLASRVVRKLASV